ncbi:MAG: terminase [Dehalococcoidia bacterium]|nr:terminase [Dehalococcoidia bacterium]
MAEQPNEALQLWDVVVAPTTGTDDLVVNFHPGQLRAWDSDRRYVWMLAGTQGGKTSYGPLWLHREIRRQGPGDYLAVTATFPLLKLKMLPEFLRLFRDTHDLGTWRASDRVFEVSRRGELLLFQQEQRTPTRVIFGSAQNSDSLESATAKAAWLDECGQDSFPQASWEAVRRRLALHRGRVLGTTTPYNLGWLKQEYDRWKRGAKDVDVIQFESIVNPAYPREEFEQARRRMPGWKFALFWQGQFEKPAGLIYDCFGDWLREDGGHLVEPRPLPVDWPRYVGIDLGAVNQARLALAYDPQEQVGYVYDELLDGNKSTAEHARKAMRDFRDLPKVTYRGGSLGEKQQRLDWRAHGIWVLGPVVRDVEAGIDRVTALLKERRLFVFTDCHGLRDEFGTYSRERDDNEEPTEKIANKERFHFLDALRYLVQGLPQEGPGVWTQMMKPQSIPFRDHDVPRRADPLPQGMA